MTIQNLVTNQFLVKYTIIQIWFLETIIFFGFGFLFWRKKIKSQQAVPESAGEDRRVALLRRQHARHRIGVCVREERIGLVLCEWIRVDYIIYYKFKVVFISLSWIIL
jgi:hypothetical protein